MSKRKNRPSYPVRAIYLDPHCNLCIDTKMGEVCWSEQPDMDHCDWCNRGPIRYIIDRRYLTKQERGDD